jgi:hypothetical protein
MPAAAPAMRPDPVDVDALVEAFLAPGIPVSRAQRKARAKRWLSAVLLAALLVGALAWLTWQAAQSALPIPKPDVTQLDGPHRYAIQMAMMLSCSGTPVVDRAELA